MCAYGIGRDVPAYFKENIPEKYSVLHRRGFTALRPTVWQLLNLDVWALGARFNDRHIRHLPHASLKCYKRGARRGCGKDGGLAGEGRRRGG